MRAVAWGVSCACGGPPRFCVTERGQGWGAFTAPPARCVAAFSQDSITDAAGERNAAGTVNVRGWPSNFVLVSAFEPGTLLARDRGSGMRSTKGPG